MGKIAAGEYDRRITIQRFAITRGSAGSLVESWINLYSNVPARVKPFTGREKFHPESEREISYKTNRFTIRYIAGLTEKDKIIYEGKSWDILNFAEIGRKEALEITAQVAK